MLMKFSASAWRTPELRKSSRHLPAPRMVGDEHEIGAQQLVRIAHQRLAHAIGEEADRGHARHRDDEGSGEDAQLARAPVASEHAQARHAAIRPPTRRTVRAQRAASASSCVTRMSVVPCSRLSSKRSAMTARARLHVEAAGRLVGEEKLRPHDESARERDALLLAAGKMLRIVLQPFAEPDAAEHGAREVLGVVASGELERKHHVLERRERRQELERLEDEAE